MTRLRSDQTTDTRRGNHLTRRERGDDAERDREDQQELALRYLRRNEMMDVAAILGLVSDGN